MPMIKCKFAVDGCESMWAEKGPLATFAPMSVWKVTKNTPARKKYGLAFKWAVSNANGTQLATGWGRTYNSALNEAVKRQNYILVNAVLKYEIPDHLSHKWENMVAD